MVNSNRFQKVPVSCVPTGVKHLHHEALNYDIGVYFEANGHGTVVFSQNAKDKLKEAAQNENLNEEQRKASKKMLNLIDVINETVGDAISDMLLVETILHDKGWSIQDWEKCYTDLPNKLTKVTVQVNINRICINRICNGFDFRIEQYSQRRTLNVNW